MQYTKKNCIFTLWVCKNEIVYVFVYRDLVRNNNDGSLSKRKKNYEKLRNKSIRADERPNERARLLFLLYSEQQDDRRKNAMGEKTRSKKLKLIRMDKNFYAQTHTNAHLYIFTYTILIYTFTHSFAIRIIFINTMTHGRPHKPYTCATTYRSFWFFFSFILIFFFLYISSRALRFASPRHF